jgi:hypothetical protein
MDEAERLLDKLTSLWDDACADIATGPHVAAYREHKAAVLAAMRKGGVPQWRTDMENAPEGPHLRGIWINVVKPNTSEPAGRYLDVYAGSIDDETGEFRTINGDDTGWPTDEFTLWCPLPEEAAALQPPALDRDAVIEACAKKIEANLFLLSIGTPGDGPFTRQSQTVKEVIEQAAAAIRAMKVQK